MKAYLILADKSVYEGESLGVLGTTVGELVFNTGMTGYQEVLTDPSYYGQLVMMTYPMIGNYGVNDGDFEADRSYVRGFVVKEAAEKPNNYRVSRTIGEYLKDSGITAISGVDTRAVTVKLRKCGTMNAVISTEYQSYEEAAQLLEGYKITDAVENASCRRIRTYGEKEALQAALLDLGLKKNIIRSLLKRGIGVTVFPADTCAEDILKINPDGIMLSNGPGNPADCKKQIDTIRRLAEADIPIFGICLGHQLTALAMGASTEKLRFGHRGANHPVRDLETGRTYITSQNHGYAVSENSLDPSIGKISHINQNDGTVEGITYHNKRIFTVQFHPEASPGPQDTAYLFDKFKAMMEEKQHA